MPERWVNPQGWGPPPPPRPPSTGGRRWRRPAVALASAVVLLGVVAVAQGDNAADPASPSTAAATTGFSLPTVATTLPTTSTAPPTTRATVEVPELVGMKATSAKAVLADRGLRGRVTYRSTDRYPAGMVISQSRDPGVDVRPRSRIVLVVAKAPPPTTTAPPPPPTAPSPDCDPSYPDVCLDPDAEDYDCAGGSGNGPEYVDGPIRVRPPDPFDLDREGDGWGCEAG